MEYQEEEVQQLVQHSSGDNDVPPKQGKEQGRKQTAKLAPSVAAAPLAAVSLVALLFCFWFFFASTKTTSHDGLASVVNLEDNNSTGNGPAVDIKELQLENYRRGTALMINVHITHHGGTTFCGAVGHALNKTAPNFACLANRPNDDVSLNYLKHRPWSYYETAENIYQVRQHFHMISWEFRKHPIPALQETNWEDPNLFSVIIMRDPMSRMLAGSAYTRDNYPGIEENHDLEQWRKFANDSFYDNYALRVLAEDNTGNQGENTERWHLETAKKLVERFTVVLDIACLDDGMAALADMLNITLNVNTKKKKRTRTHAHPRERIGYDEVYEYLLRKFHLDIEMYEWSKAKALVNCSALPHQRYNYR